eukprot:PhF_6_TR10154/c0_g1_i1/m.15766
MRTSRRSAPSTINSPKKRQQATTQTKQQQETETIATAIAPTLAMLDAKKSSLLSLSQNQLAGVAPSGVPVAQHHCQEPALMSPKKGQQHPPTELTDPPATTTTTTATSSYKEALAALHREEGAFQPHNMKAQEPSMASVVGSGGKGGSGTGSNNKDKERSKKLEEFGKRMRDGKGESWMAHKLSFTE